MLDYCWSLYCVGQKKTGINWLASKALSELGTALPHLFPIFLLFEDLNQNRLIVCLQEVRCN